MAEHKHGFVFRREKDDGTIAITICHGPKKIKTDIASVSQLTELKQKIENLLSIKRDGQKLIFKGKLLSDEEASIASLGLKNGDVVMVLGKVARIDNDPLINELDKIGNTFKETEVRVKTIINNIETIHNESVRTAASQSDLKESMGKLLFTNEELMKLLETLDAMEIEGNSNNTREKRKKMVKDIQKLMDQVDEDYSRFERIKMNYVPGQPHQNSSGQPQQDTLGQPQQNSPGQPQQNIPGKPQQDCSGQPQYHYPVLQSSMYAYSGQQEQQGHLCQMPQYDYPGQLERHHGQMTHDEYSGQLQGYPGQMPQYGFQEQLQGYPNQLPQYCYPQRQGHPGQMPHYGYQEQLQGYPEQQQMSGPQPGYGSPQIDPNLAAWFRAADQDNTGQIHAVELQTALWNGSQVCFSEEACRSMIEMFDKDGSGTVNIQEFSHLFRYVIHWTDIYRRYDHDVSGNIDEREMAIALQQIGYRLSPQFVSCLVSKFAPKNRRLTLDNFIVSNVQINRLTEMFKIKDTKREGVVTLSYEEFMALLMGY